MSVFENIITFLSHHYPYLCNAADINNNIIIYEKNTFINDRGRCHNGRVHGEKGRR